VDFITDTKKVRTKSGYFTQETGDIVFDEGVINYLKNLYRGYWVEGDSLHKLLLFSLVLSLGLALFSIFLLSALSPLFYIVMVVSFPTGLLSVVLFNQFFTNFTDDNRISINNIHFARVKKGRKFITGPKITFMYKEGRKDKKRAVDMPSLMEPKSEEILSDAKEFLRDYNIKVK